MIQVGPCELVVVRVCVFEAAPEKVAVIEPRPVQVGPSEIDTFETGTAKVNVLGRCAWESPFARILVAARLSWMTNVDAIENRHSEIGVTKCADHETEVLSSEIGSNSALPVTLEPHLVLSHDEIHLIVLYVFRVMLFHAALLRTQ